MPTRRLPPLHALRAFEAAARHHSLSRAADELAVTVGAISRQVAKLEDFLGAKLFERRHQQVVLTESGAAYAAKLQSLFDNLQQTTDAHFDLRPDPGLLRIGVFSTYALHFLMPRLARFKQRFPEIKLELDSAAKPIDPNDRNVDLSIWLGNGDWPNLVVEHLFDEEVMPVASPALLNGQQIGHADDLAPFLLLHSVRRLDDWEVWLKAAGATKVDAYRGLRLENSTLVYEAARNGLGLAMAQTMLIADGIAHERLVPVMDLPVRTGRAGYLVCSEAKAGKRNIVLFSQWLKDEVNSAMAALQPSGEKLKQA